MDTQTPDPAEPRPSEPGPAPSSYTSPVTPPPPAPPGDSAFFASVRRSGLVRSDERWIGGVAGGIALRLGVDPLLVRGILGASVLLGGLGMVLYGIGWALLPEQKDGRIHLEETIRGRFDAALLGAVALLIVGLNRNDHWFGWWGGGDLGWLNGLLWVAAVVVAVVVVVKAAGNRRTPPPYGPYPGIPAPGAPGTSAAGTAGPGATASGTAAGDVAAETTSYGPVRLTKTPEPAASAPYPTAPYPAVPPYPAQPSPTPPSPTQPYPTQGYAPAPPPPPRAPRVSTPGPGSTTFGIVAALVLLTFAVLLAAERSGDFTGPVGLTGGAAAIVLLGLAAMVSGLRGRRSSGLGTLAVLTTLVVLPLAWAGDRDWTWDGDSHAAIADTDFVVTERDVATRGYDLGLGDSTVDLSDVELTDETLRVPVDMGAGTLRVIVPEGAAVVADVTLGAGDITWDVDEPLEKSGGVGLGERSYRSDEVVDGTAPELALVVTLGAGDITIEEAR
ncbi:PspC domain-containing protein [Cellulomonas sp. NS3]|uniref:PspC domain-containing protein n=1 Tax=Cellulomonas sp. NS3 TaxID=2973977 RepID=UPI0021614444|nr:PspC domain-containing protein [Cellulomonas sp. NS3]